MGRTIAQVGGTLQGPVEYAAEIASEDAETEELNPRKDDDDGSQEGKTRDTAPVGDIAREHIGEKDDAEHGKGQTGKAGQMQGGRAETETMLKAWAASFRRL